MPALTTLAALGISGTRLPAVLAMGFYLAINALTFQQGWETTGTLTFSNSQDWRGSVEEIQRYARPSQDTVLLYRSGFVEEDGVVNGHVPEADLAPLRQPGRLRPGIPTVPLSFHWQLEGRAEYFDNVVRPRVSQPGTRVLFVSSCLLDDCGYREQLISWLRSVTRGRIRVQTLDRRHIGMFVADIGVPQERQTDADGPEKP
jgi:hypothetical protein